MPGLVDFFLSFVVLLIMMLGYRIPFGPRIFMLPVFLLLAIGSALAVGLWFSALNVQYRDVRYVVPFLATFWQYATPIGCSAEPRPRALAHVLPGLQSDDRRRDGVSLGAARRRATLDASVWVSGAITLVLLVSGVFYFKRMEDTFADVI